MNIFCEYAPYYELLYQDKDYAGEARFVKKLLEHHSSGAKSILELGCGSGKHAILLAEMGYLIHGVDRSAEMLEQARRKAVGLKQEIAGRLAWNEGDIRSIRINKRFDAAISLFHVISYQLTGEDLRATFTTAASHLKPGGVFLFDCWYGPAVLSKQPEIRVKRMEDKKISVTRLSEPEILPNENKVIVNYTVFIRDKKTKVINQIQESHQMRYLFKTDIEELFKGVGMKLVDAGEWMSERNLGLNTFGAYFIGIKNT